MLGPIKNCGDHIVCYADPETGELVSRYKKQTTRTTVPIGGSVMIARDGIVTEIIRVSTSEFKVNSYYAVA